MKVKKISAIIRSSVLSEVEKRLKEIGVKGMSVSSVRGFGQGMDEWTFNPNKLVGHAKIEIWAREEMASQIVHVILDSAQTGLADDGMVAVSPVEHVWRVRTKTEATEDEI